MGAKAGRNRRGGGDRPKKGAAPKGAGRRGGSGTAQRLGLARARRVEVRGGRLSVTGVELDSEAAGVLAEQVGGALYEWREQTAALRVAGDPDERLAAVLAMAAGLREARRASEPAAA